jgi:hypothetical protein
MAQGKSVMGHSAHSCSKPTGYVNMHYTLSATETNEEITASIKLISEQESKILDYRVVLDSGLEKISLKSNKTQEGVYEMVEIDLKTLAVQKGSFYIRIYTKAYSSYNPDDIRHKSFVVPIQVGEAKKKRTRENSSENLKIYQGMERIR